MLIVGGGLYSCTSTNCHDAFEECGVGHVCEIAAG
jgi:hypothetical protein